MYDSYNAYYVKKKSTSNCVRGYNSTPSICISNLIINKGNSKDIFKEIKEGVFIRNLIGAHTMDATTGDFSLGIAEGHYVKNGEIEPIKDAMIAGNFFKLMKDIKVMSNKLEHNAGYYSPMVLFNDIKVIGK